MVTPKTIGKSVFSSSTKASERRKEAKAMIPIQNTVRDVEAFNATPTLNQYEPIITEENSTFEFLRLARITLDKKHEAYKAITCSLASEEAIYYVNRGQANFSIGEDSFQLNKGDCLYVGINQKIDISTESFGDVSEFKAVKCHTSYPLQLIRHSDIEGTELAADLGNKRPGTKRTVFKLVDSANVQACRLLFGDTYMASPGGVGSYPPHFHGPDGPYGFGEEAKEEIYHFRVESDINGDTPYVLQNCAYPGEEVGAYVHIFDEMAINVTPGYHDTIAPPSVDVMFTWCLASYKEGHRDWAQILNKPGYEDEW